VDASVDHGRLEFLDAVRGLAALLVVLQHVLEGFPALRPFLTRFNLGAMGVAAFFLVSGFIIPFSLERANDLLRFWIGRFFRIWPLYLLTLFVVTAGVYLRFATPMPGYAEGVPRTTLVNLTTLQHLLRQPSAIGAYWTLSYETLFYAACSVLFLLRIVKRADFFVPICTALFVVKGAQGGSSFGFTLIFLAFATGMLVCRSTFGEIPRRRAMIVGAIAASAVLATVASHAGRLAIQVDGRESALCDVVSYAAGYALFFTLYALRRGEFPRWLTYLGEISYSVYLVHGMLFAFRLPGGLELHGVLIVGLTALLAPLTYRFVEQPAVAFGRRVAKTRTRITA